MGCTRNPTLVEEAARITAREVIATGMHRTFGPCVAVPRDVRWGRTYEGFGVSDWKALEQLPGDYPQQIERSIDAGVDMVMVPDIYPEFFEALKTLVVSGRLPIARIDDAVRRILTVKVRMGLFERPFGDPSLLAAVGSAGHRAVARQAVR
jgi:beta-glucosidase-like glycosyl hydrolase